MSALSADIADIDAAKGQELPKVEEYPNRFECFKPGLGLYRGPPVDIEMDPTVKPIFLKARTLPYAKRAWVEKELLSMIEDGTLTRVQTSSWATPIIKRKWSISNLRGL